MAITQRCYGKETDFDTVSDFLVRHYRPLNRDGNCFQPIWEYSYTHPYTDLSLLDKIGIWEDDNELKKTVESRGYQRDPEHDRAMVQFKIPKPFPPIRLPEGFKLKSLAEDNDLRKIHRVIHRGFDHPGEPPEDELKDKKRMQSGPHFRKDLNIVVEAPTGDFVSYCGMWYDSVNHFAYVEPVATDPDYRRRGFASAAVLEGIRRCAIEGATVAYVWGVRPIYTSLGFKKIFSQNCWIKQFDD